MAIINTNIGPERVQVFSQPLGTVQVPGAGVSTAAFIISTSKSGAPENAPTLITSMSEFEDQFGDADEVNNQAYYHVLGWFDNAGEGSPAYIVNVGDSATADDFIGNSADETGLRALDNLDASMLVMIPGLPLELAYLVDPQLIDYTETIRADFGATLSTSFSILSIPKEISKVNKDEVVSSPLFLSVSGSGPYDIVVEDTLGSGTADLSEVKPGMIIEDDSLSFFAVVTAVDDGTDTITIAADPASTWSAGDNVNIKIPSAVRYKEEVVNNPSKVAAWYYNTLQVLDQSASASPGDLILVDPVGHVAGVFARIDAQTAIGGVSHAPAGIQFGGIAGIQGLGLSISERTEAEPLRLNFINRITSFPGSGNVIFGGYTADSGTSPSFTADEQLVQVMRTIQFLKASLEPGLRPFLWENQDPVNDGRISGAILSFLRNNSYLFPRGLSESQKFRVIPVEATQNEIDQGLVRVRVQVRPNKAIRFIEVALEFPIPAS